MLTWVQALNSVIEYTELGYTQKSCDRIWHIVTVEDREDDDEYQGYKGNWLYLAEKFISYDPMDETLCFLSRREAQAYRDSLDERRRDRWHTINLGDMVRHERRYLEHRDVGLYGEGFTPKFRGSDDAFELKRAVAHA